jgi:hypothetical protein
MHPRYDSGWMEFFCVRVGLKLYIYEGITRYSILRIPCIIVFVYQRFSYKYALKNIDFRSISIAMRNFPLPELP